MKCYNHHERDAFGICKVCGKGLCLECMKNESGIIACKNDKTCLNRIKWHKILNTIILILIAAVILLFIFD